MPEMHKDYGSKMLKNLCTQHCTVGYNILCFKTTNPLHSKDSIGSTRESCSGAGGLQGQGRAWLLASCQQCEQPWAGGGGGVSQSKENKTNFPNKLRKMKPARKKINKTLCAEKKEKRKGGSRFFKMQINGGPLLKKAERGLSGE